MGFRGPLLIPALHFCLKRFDCLLFIKQLDVIKKMLNDSRVALGDLATAPQQREMSPVAEQLAA
jgi:hypothetical protein